MHPDPGHNPAFYSPQFLEAKRFISEIRRVIDLD